VILASESAAVLGAFCLFFLQGIADSPNKEINLLNRPTSRRFRKDDQEKWKAANINTGNETVAMGVHLSGACTSGVHLSGACTSGVHLSGRAPY
jgi:hypothetical protein